MPERFSLVCLSDDGDRQDFTWGYQDGLDDKPLPEFLPPPAYFAGREAGKAARHQNEQAA